MGRNVYHHRGSVGVTIPRQPERAQGNQRVGPAGFLAGRTLLARHHRNLIGQTIQCLGYHRAL
jgi:hypothetical protein